MCGIAGIVGPWNDPTAIERMVARLGHRGPDDSGVWRGAGAALGHTRLAILDTSDKGHQPMVLGDLALTYNGELYNFRELREDLPGPFRSACDTEVLLRSFARDGDACLAGLRGMFAFAVWDVRRKRLFAARDRVGMKPLYYMPLPGGGVAFASELKALRELGRPEVDRTAIRDYFTYKYVPSPKTIWRGIYQLPPGHSLAWDGALHVNRYWNPTSSTDITDSEEAVRELRRLLEEIIPQHTLSDVPVGVFLSGGIDSTTIVAHLEKPKTFTLGVDIKRRDESGKAQQVAEHFGTDHRVEIAEAIDIDEAIETIPQIYDEPFGDSSAWATHLVSRMARRHVTVALSGEGGDELFGGYQWYSKWPSQRSTALRRTLASALPPFSSLARSSQRRAAQGLERYAAFLGAFTLPQKRALLSRELLEDDYDDLWHFREYWREDLQPIKRLQWIDLHTYLPGDLLTKVDRASMATSLEVRPPLLDHRLIEFALALDPRLIRDVEGNRGKLLLRQLMDGRVPVGLFEQPKRGFNLPIRTWLRSKPHLLSEAVARLHAEGILRRRGYPTFTHEQSWSILVLDRWLLRNELYQHSAR